MQRTLIDPLPAVKPNKEETGLGGDARAEGPMHALRGVAFLIGLAVVAVVIIFGVSAFHH